MRRYVLTSAVALILALAGCTTPAPPPTPPAEAPSAPPEPAAPPRTATPAEQQQAQKIARHVAELLDGGNEAEARTEIDRALALDPNNKLAQNFLRQITVDPASALGTESFAYTVRPGETLSQIAGRYLNDFYAFYLLARYNDVKVPRLVSSGQTIRVPGKAPPPETIKPPRPPSVEQPKPTRPPRTVERPVEKPIEKPVEKPADKPAEKPVADREGPEPAPPSAPPPPAPPLVPAREVVTPAEKAYREGLAAQRTGNRERAYQQFRQAAQLDSSHADAKSKADQVRRELAVQHERNARAAFARQDLDGAIRSWDRVLDFDPGNDTARLEKQKAQALKQRIEKVN